jgi:phage tail sheath protein FI
MQPEGVASTVDVPPSGFVMGVYARTDNDRGVWKAPANERVKGLDHLIVPYTQRRQDLLNPKGVNLLRSFPGRGMRIWGARNLTDDTQWRYVNVRRLFLFLENSIDGGTQWVVFEPNDATTWLRVRVSVENFLNQVWRAGGLAGATPEQAYRVRVGLGQTMTETDIELGLLIIEVAVAPVYPAEFVVFRISHKRLTE